MQLLKSLLRKTILFAPPIKLIIAAFLLLILLYFLNPGPYVGLSRPCTP